MIFDDYAIQAGKFAGCYPSDVPREELRYWAFRGSSTPLDRLALQEHFRHTRRTGATWPAPVASPHPGEQRAVAGACARSVGHSLGIGDRQAIGGE
jgi:hypothetical protein